MHRRRFFKLAGGSAASLAGFGVTRNMAGQVQDPLRLLPPAPPIGLPPVYPRPTGTIWDTSAAAFATVVPQGTYVTPNGAAWATLSSALASLYASLQANPAYDQSMMAAASRVSVSSVLSANIDQAALLADLQTTTPELTAADLQRRLSYLDTFTAGQKQIILGQLASSGISPFVYNLMSSTASLANLITPGSAISVPHCEFTLPPPPPGGGDPITGGGGCGGGPHPSPPPPPPTSKQEWCDRVALTLIAAGVALVAIDFLSDGAAVPLNGLIWQGVVKWGTRGAGSAGAGLFIAGCF